MAAHCTGHTSITGRSARTIPPEWMPRWRGASRSCWARAITSSGTSASFSEEKERSIRLAKASCAPGS